MTIDRHFTQPIIVASKEWLSVHISHNLLWWAIVAIDRHLSISHNLIYIYMACNGHRWTRFTIFCVRQCLSINNTSSLLSQTISIDILYLPHSTVADNIHTSIDSPPRMFVEAVDYYIVLSIVQSVWYALQVHHHPVILTIIAIPCTYLGYHTSHTTEPAFAWLGRWSACRLRSVSRVRESKNECMLLRRKDIFFHRKWLAESERG